MEEVGDKSWLAYVQHLEASVALENKEQQRKKHFRDYGFVLSV